jgi:hypothetical protein
LWPEGRRYIPDHPVLEPTRSHRPAGNGHAVQTASRETRQVQREPGPHSLSGVLVASLNRIPHGFSAADRA